MRSSGSSRASPSSSFRPGAADSTRSPGGPGGAGNPPASLFPRGAAPPALLFAAATLFIILVLLHYSTVLSKLTDESVILAQKVALLEQRLEEGLDARRGAE